MADQGLAGLLMSEVRRLVEESPQAPWLGVPGQSIEKGRGVRPFFEELVSMSCFGRLVCLLEEGLQIFPVAGGRRLMRYHSECSADCRPWLIEPSIPTLVAKEGNAGRGDGSTRSHRNRHSFLSGHEAGLQRAGQTLPPGARTANGDVGVRPPRLCRACRDQRVSQAPTADRAAVPPRSCRRSPWPSGWGDR